MFLSCWSTGHCLCGSTDVLVLLRTLLLQDGDLPILALHEVNVSTDLLRSLAALLLVDLHTLLLGGDLAPGLGHRDTDLQVVCGAPGLGLGLTDLLIDGPAPGPGDLLASCVTGRGQREELGRGSGRGRGTGQ